MIREMMREIEEDFNEGLSPEEKYNKMSSELYKKSLKCNDKCGNPKSKKYFDCSSKCQTERFKALEKYAEEIGY